MSAHVFLNLLNELRKSYKKFILEVQCIEILNFTL